MNIQHLTYGFPRTKAVFFDDVSFSLQSPGVNFLIGENGAGKTTLADILTGSRPSNLALTWQAIYLNQQLPMLSSVRVCDVAQLVLGIEYGERHLTLARLQKRVDAATLTFLTPLWQQRYGQLSGGQRKLVQLLLFLQVDRQLVVLDEPTAAIDRQNVQRLFAGMRAHSERTYLVITHDSRDVAAFDAFNVLWLHQHRIKCYQPQAFYQAAQTEPFLGAFVAGH
ncbi:ATP-binding cassette domain-containing protein [Lactiplantibacillus modestisalitolerans]|uniref:ATP-binding cassette domain-containing protein n=1 Tax=Lactiplantibacillus modestisalitolerans TaxID=1457219 RepID=A0ABV5WWF2_9LACO|nr:ATP-binding cassette domain-containing protein [Lactiplantibacillus modestisalitolerans]